jgi:hypothetical protein
MAMATDHDDAIAQEYQAIEMAEYQHTASKLNKLTVKDLRILLVHYKLDNKRGAREWCKADLVDAVACEMTGEWL